MVIFGKIMNETRHVIQIKGIITIFLTISGVLGKVFPFICTYFYGKLSRISADYAKAAHFSEKRRMRMGAKVIHIKNSKGHSKYIRFSFFSKSVSIYLKLKRILFIHYF